LANDSRQWLHSTFASIHDELAPILDSLSLTLSLPLRHLRPLHLYLIMSWDIILDFDVDVVDSVVVEPFVN